MVDIKYSQNFYKNKDTLSRVIQSINISKKDIVLDIGAGSGNITKELAKYSDNVIAYELDSNLFNTLKENLEEFPNVKFRNEDFLITELPRKKFKVFSNIPFSVTSDIINKITNIKSNLDQAFLFVQKESAKRYMGKPLNTQISTILSFKYSFSIIENFKREDFKPIPSVDIVLLKIQRKDTPIQEFILYRDFVTYIFNQRNSNVLDTLKKLFTFNQLKHIKKFLEKNGYTRPSDIPSDYYIEIFQYFKTNGRSYTTKVNHYYEKHIKQHLGRERINRTSFVQ